MAPAAARISVVGGGHLQRWAAACETAGISGLHFHDLRGSGSTWAAIAGATLPELMHRLGHKTPTAAMRYQHATSERHRQVADRLGALLQPGAVEPEPVADVVNITGPKWAR